MPYLRCRDIVSMMRPFVYCYTVSYASVCFSHRKTSALYQSLVDLRPRY